MSEKDEKDEKKGGRRDNDRVREVMKKREGQKERYDSGTSGNNKDQTTLRQTKRP